MEHDPRDTAPITHQEALLFLQQFSISDEERAINAARIRKQVDCYTIADDVWPSTYDIDFCEHSLYLLDQYFREIMKGDVAGSVRAGNTILKFFPFEIRQAAYHFAWGMYYGADDGSCYWTQCYSEVDKFLYDSDRFPPDHNDYFTEHGKKPDDQEEYYALRLKAVDRDAVLFARWLWRRSWRPNWSTEHHLKFPRILRDIAIIMLWVNQKKNYLSFPLLYYLIGWVVDCSYVANTRKDIMRERKERISIKWRVSPECELSRIDPTANSE